MVGVQYLFQCDQCGYEEWRDPDQDTWLCAVCGSMRWSVVATEADEAAGPNPDDRADG